MKNKTRSGAILLLTAFVGAAAAQEVPSEEPDYDTAPVLREKVLAIYPDEAKAADVQGAVWLQIRIETDGATSYLRVTNSLGRGCDEAAIEAAKQWTWKPALKDGEPVAVIGVISFNFPPEESGNKQR